MIPKACNAEPWLTPCCMIWFFLLNLFSFYFLFIFLSFFWKLFKKYACEWCLLLWSPPWKLRCSYLCCLSNISHFFFFYKFFSSKKLVKQIIWNYNTWILSRQPKYSYPIVSHRTHATFLCIKPCPCHSISCLCIQAISRAYLVLSSNFRLDLHSDFLWPNFYNFSFFFFGIYAILCF